MRMRRRVPLSAADEGFTLLELLIATTLLGVLLAIMAGGVRFGARVWERSWTISEATTEVNTAREFMRQRLAEARNISDGRDATEAGQVAFEGSANSVEFVAEMPAFVAPHGLFWITLKLDRPSGNLVLSWWPYRGLPDGSRQKILLGNVSGVSFSYFGKRTGDEAEAWSDSWSGATYLPDLVRISITFSQGVDWIWPELIVAIPGAGAPLARNNQS